ncbi:Dabb family protein [Geofilum rhodophaeum]|uniref:Dabb family protein n=1 Tax=Geofilum rhodophaeum TaxID=1965019 RepID=UPI000B529355|nr:Dabb family protein [Geofilum rhodophaeum]
MIKHVVLFKFKAEVRQEAGQEQLLSLKKELEMLKVHIPELKHIEAGINANPKEEYDLALLTEFADWQALQVYVVHPDHQKVAKKIRAILEERACVDYEF